MISLSLYTIYNNLIYILFVGMNYVNNIQFIWILYFGCEKDTTVGKLTNSNGILRNVQTTNKNPNNSYNLQSVNNENSIQNEPSNSIIANQSTNLRAEALFDYSANKEDPNEISFSQGEIMDILDNNVKKKNIIIILIII